MSEFFNESAQPLSCREIFSALLRKSDISALNFLKFGNLPRICVIERHSPTDPFEIYKN